jgi:hypothetical protein
MGNKILQENLSLVLFIDSYQQIILDVQHTAINWTVQEYQYQNSRRNILLRSHLIANVWDNIDPSMAIVVHYSQQGK